MTWWIRDWDNSSTQTDIGQKLFWVWENDLMNKGLRLVSPDGKVGHPTFRFERMTWWIRDWNNCLRGVRPQHSTGRWGYWRFLYRRFLKYYWVNTIGELKLIKYCKAWLNFSVKNCKAVDSIFESSPSWDYPSLLLRIDPVLFRKTLCPLIDIVYQLWWFLVMIRWDAEKIKLLGTSNNSL